MVFPVTLCGSKNWTLKKGRKVLKLLNSVLEMISENTKDSQEN